MPTDFHALRLDDRANAGGPVLGVALNVPVEAFDTGAAALASVPRGERDGDLSPAQWRAERLRGERQARVTRRVVLGAAFYLGALVLAFLALGVMKFRVGRLDSRLKTVRPSRWPRRRTPPGGKRSRRPSTGSAPSWKT